MEVFILPRLIFFIFFNLPASFAFLKAPSLRVPQTKQYSSPLRGPIYEIFTLPTLPNNNRSVNSPQMKTVHPLLLLLAPLLRECALKDAVLEISPL